MTEPEPRPSILHQLEAHEEELVRGLLERLRLARYLARFPARPVWAAFMFINGFATIGLLSVLAMAFHVPFIFPSLGPTAFLFFFHPSSPAATPRNALLGHAIGILCGYGALWVTGLAHVSLTLEEVNAPRVLAAALSLAASGAVMILCRVAHPPAGATTLIVSLGFIKAPFYLFLIEVAVLLMTVQAVVINRLAGLNYPWWGTRPPARLPPGRPTLPRG
jgi:CBS-domain-containing membrane protein